MNELTELLHNPLFEKIREYLRQHDSENQIIFLFVPYIKTAVLEKLLDGIQSKAVVVTTWKPRDIQLGSSDLSLYPFCKERKIALYINEKIHLKVYSVGLESAVLATGNISNRGMMSGGSYEAGTIIENLTNEDRWYFENIRREARLVDDTMYMELKEWSEKNQIELPEQIQLDDIISKPRQDDFLISALPMTKNVDKLVSGYRRISMGEEPSENQETVACIFHDLANYGIKPGMSESEFIQVLSSRFFAHPFIKKIDEFIAPEAYFGSTKVWIQNNCTDVPIPSRRDLTENVQVLLEWFEKLGNGRYVIDRPRHSQRIRKIKS